MSRFGVWQLKKLTLNTCPWGGSSRGARAFKESFLQQLKAENPQIAIAEVEQRNKHPTLFAEYRNGRVRSVDLKNKDESEILRLAYVLRSSAGRKTTNALSRQVMPKVYLEGSNGVQQAQNSVQGRWTPTTF